MKGIGVSFVPTIGIKLAKSEKELGSTFYIFLLSVIIALPPLFGMITSSIPLVTNPSKYVVNFPEVKVIDGIVQTDVECDSVWQEEETGLEIYFLHCSDSIPNDLPENSIILTSEHISIVKKSGEIRSFAAGHFGDWEITQAKLESWIQIFTIPLVFLGFLFFVLIQFVVRNIQIIIISLFINLLLRISSYEFSNQDEMNRVVFLSIIPTAVIDALFGKFEIIKEYSWYLLLFYFLFYTVLIFKDSQKKGKNIEA